MARLWRVVIAASLVIAYPLASAGAIHAAAPAAHGFTPGGTVATAVKRISLPEAARIRQPAPGSGRSAPRLFLDPKAVAAAKANPKASQAVVRGAAPKKAGISAHSVPSNPIALESHDMAKSVFGQDIEPPDTQVAAGPTQLVELINDVARVTDKSGTELKVADLNVFFPTPPAGLFYTDPRVVYNAESGRWFVSAVSFKGTPNFASELVVGVSTSSDALQPFVFHRLINDSSRLCDQPKLGLNTDKATISCALYTGSGSQPTFNGQGTVVINKSELMAGGSIHAWVFVDGNLFSAVPAISLAPTTTAFMVENGSLFSQSANVCHTVVLTAFTGVPSAGTPNPTPANRADSCLPFPQTAIPPNAQQPNSTNTLDTGDGRFLSATLQNGVLWTGGSDACIPGGDSMVRSCLRLVEVSTGGPTVSSSFDLGGTQMYQFDPAVTMAVNGDLFVGFSASSSSIFPTVGVASVPLAGQASGTPDLVDITTIGTTTYADSFNLFRWGDYSAAAPDPAMPGTVWLAGEYAAGSSDRAWGTAVVKVIEPPAAPTSISPNNGPEAGGQSVTISGSFFQPGATVSFGSQGHLATSVVVAPDGNSITAKTPSGSPGPAAVTVTNPDLQQGTVPGGYTYNPPGAVGNTFFFAEGTTLSGFNETLYLLMPNSSGNAMVTYFTEAGPVGPITHAMTAGQVTPVSVVTDVGPNHAVSARVDLSAPGVAERLLNFDVNFGQHWHGSTDKVGVTAPNTEWDFAEGSTLSQFTEFLTLQNPDTTKASNVSINYFTDQGAKVTKTITLPAGSRTTVRVPDGDQTNTNCTINSNGDAVHCGIGPNLAGVSAQVVVNNDGSPAIIAERPFYVNGFSFGSGVINDGHVAFGANSPAATWNFAEGTTLSGFNEFLTLQNPGTVTSNVSINYFTNTGQTVTRTLDLPATSRTTLNVNLGDTSPGPRHCTVSGGQAMNCGVGAGVIGVSASVTVTGGANIVAERPIYVFRDFGSGPVAGATDVVGANSFGTLFGFSSAQTVAGENDYLTIQNPNSGQATATITYYDSASGFPRTATIVVPANTRQTVQVFAPPSPGTGGAGPGLVNLGIVVSSDLPVLVEKPTYNSTAARFGATDTLGFTPNPAF